MSKFYVIECHDNVGVKDTQVHGPFPSVAAAKRCIREGAEDIDIKGNDLHEGRNTDWGSNHIIVEEVDVFKPIPVVKMRVELSKVVDGQPEKDEDDVCDYHHVECEEGW